MKFIRTGLTKGTSTSLLHDLVYVKGGKGLSVSGYCLSSDQINRHELNSPVFVFCSNEKLLVKANSGVLSIVPVAYNQSENLADSLIKDMSTKGLRNKVSVLVIKIQNNPDKIIISDDPQFVHERIYKSELIIVAQGNELRLILNTSLEDYVVSVLKAEMPSNYNLEAIKTQAVSARTYGMRPRVNHKQDLCNVCDSYLCCQAFSGWQANVDPVYERACDETKGQILVYKDKPILALFSSCAGGHTENYQDCFSDWDTGRFPPEPISYLSAVSEFHCQTSADQVFDEEALKKIWHSPNVSTFDSWSKKFRWSYKFSIQDLESSLHYTLSELMTRQETAPFIIPAPSGLVGSLQAFSIERRGVGGTVVILIIHTSKGSWKIIKELTIRSLFSNKILGVKRLPSAKIFFDEDRDDKKQLLSLSIYGLGSGHGVGMQQVGAEGMARLNFNYQKILAHYYKSAQVITL